jgi:hypothetical protein
MDRKLFTRLLVLSILMVLLSLSADAQCAMCNQTAETSMKNDPSSLARNLNKGILYLLVLPYLMIGFIFRKQLFSAWKKISGKFPRRASGI